MARSSAIRNPGVAGGDLQKTLSWCTAVRVRTENVRLSSKKGVVYMKGNFRLSLLLVSLLLSVIGTSVIGFSASSDDTLTIAIRNWDYDTIDPHISTFTQSMWMINCFTDQLVRIGPDGKFHPGLASSWEAIDDGLSWVFHLREGVTFHDGTPWNADACVANFERVLDPDTKSLRFVDKLEGITSIDVLDPMTVKLTFDTPKPGLLLSISEPLCGFLSPSAFNDPENTKHEDQLKGTGPYILEEEIYQQRVTFVRNPDYEWGAEFADHQGPAYINKIVWRFIPEDETRLAALQSDEVDVISEVPSAEIQTIEASNQLSILFFGKPGIAQVYHLNAKLFPTDDLAVRKAINYAIDQETVSRVIFNDSRPPAYGLLMPPSPYYNDEIEDMYPYDPEKAVEVLEAAGWVDPTGTGSGTRMKDGHVLAFDFVTYPGFVAEAPAEMAQAMLRKVGIQMNITVLTGGAMMEQAGMVDSNYNSCVCGDSAIDSAMELYYFCHSDMIGMYNFSHYSTPEIDGLIDQALATTDESVKEEAVKEVQKIWMEQALCAPTVCSTNVWGVNNRVSDVEFLIDGTPSFYDAKL